MALVVPYNTPVVKRMAEQSNALHRSLDAWLAAQPSDSEWRAKVPSLLEHYDNIRSLQSRGLDRGRAPERRVHPLLRLMLRDSRRLPRGLGYVDAQDPGTLPREPPVGNLGCDEVPGYVLLKHASASTNSLLDKVFYMPGTADQLNAGKARTVTLEDQPHFYIFGRIDTICSPSDIYLSPFYDTRARAAATGDTRVLTRVGECKWGASCKWGADCRFSHSSGWQ